MSHSVKTTIFFDYESTWGMPTNQVYDLTATTKALLDVLKQHNAVAVFNTTGKIVETQPELVKLIATAGHEIAIHGYDHTNPAHMSAADNRQFEADLSRVETKITELVGERPIGFRSPHLGAPRFFDPATYDIFARHGYAWASNRELRFIDEATSPHVTGRGDAIGLAGTFIARLHLDRLQPLRLAAYALLNLRMLWHDQTTRTFNLEANLRWLFRPAPFQREHLTEIPVLSPLDCDFLGDQIIPAEPSSGATIDHMVTSLCRQFDEAKDYFNLNFHDWVIGTSNRIDVLDRTLTYINASNRSTWTLARDLVTPTTPPTKP
jgi:peptidoglycan/xylan/chitin deacetylase (PgdA/CDA1 family)